MEKLELALHIVQILFYSAVIGYMIRRWRE